MIENIVQPDTDESEIAQKQPKAVRTTPPSKVVPLVLKAMKDLDPDAAWYNLGIVGGQVNRMQPDFDVRTYGSTKLSDLLRLTGQFEVKQIENYLRVRPKP